MLAAIRRFAASGGLIYAECGGLMYLTDAIRTLDGARWPMAAIIPGVAVMSERLQAIGYVEVETRADSILGPAQTRFRGHQFRHSTLEGADSGESDRSHLQRGAAMGWRSVRRRLSRRKCSRVIRSRALGVESRGREGAYRCVHSVARSKTTGCVASRIAVMSSDRADQNRSKDRAKIPGDFPAAPLTLEGYSILHQMFRVRRRQLRALDACETRRGNQRSVEAVRRDGAARGR